jgi:uncharacterized protein YndB with AHSA1/START domain
LQVANIYQDFPIRGSIDAVFHAISTPEGLDQWWTLRAAGQPRLGAEYELWFGPEHDWRATVTGCEPGVAFELKMGRSDDDWKGTMIGFELEQRSETVWTRFYHRGWPSANEHFRISTHCWAMYLRVLRRFIEHGETVPYAQRLDV